MKIEIKVVKELKHPKDALEGMKYALNAVEDVYLRRSSLCNTAYKRGDDEDGLWFYAVGCGLLAAKDAIKSAIKEMEVERNEREQTGQS